MTIKIMLLAASGVIGAVLLLAWDYYLSRNLKELESRINTLESSLDNLDTSVLANQVNILDLSDKYMSQTLGLNTCQVGQTRRTKQ